jgi:uncharacterized small protein (DUF1192 family)
MIKKCSVEPTASLRVSMIVINRVKQWIQLTLWMGIIAMALSPVLAGSTKSLSLTQFEELHQRVSIVSQEVSGTQTKLASTPNTPGANSAQHAALEKQYARLQAHLKSLEAELSKASPLYASPAAVKSVSIPIGRKS